MHLITLLLPLYDNDGNRFAKAIYIKVRDELIAEFGGVTAFTRAPADGAWQDKPGNTVEDDIVIYEVMTERLDHSWWTRYRTELEQRFAQDKIVVRAQNIQLL